MKFWQSVSILLLGVMLASCVPGGRSGDGRFGRPGDGRSGDSRGGWELLGEQTADFRTDRDRINVGRSDGRFSALRIVVRGAPLEMSNMVVTFGDGKTFSPNLRARFAENSWSREIDLPGDRRVIRSVEFTYRSIDRRDGRATLMLYGR